MRLFTALLLALSLVLFAGSLTAAAPDTLTILHINDTHSNLAAHGPRAADLAGTQGGIARAATVVGMTRMTDPNVLFLHAGDFSIGDLIYNFTFGVPELQILQQLGLDALAVGNHEFDLTPAALTGALAGAFGAEPPFPLLSANAVLDSPSVVTLKSYIQPHLVKDIGGLKVGIIGLTTPEANLISQPAPVFIDTAIDVILEREITALVTAGTHVNLLLSHMGRRYDRMIAASTPYLHVIVGGHDHDALPDPEPVVNPLGDTTWIVQAGANYSFVGKLRLAVDGASVRPLDYQLILLDESVPPEPSVDSVANALESFVSMTIGQDLGQALPTTEVIRDRIISLLNGFYPAAIIDPIANDTVGLAELLVDLPARHEAITPIGILVSAAARIAGMTDVGLTVAGATAQSLPDGYVTGFDLYRMIGYGFNEQDALGYRLVTFSIKGTDLLLALEWGLSSAELNDEYFPIGYPLRFTFDATRPALGRVDSVWINGAPLDTGRIYSVTSNEFVYAVLSTYVASIVGITVSEPVILDGVTELSAVLSYLNTGVKVEDPSSDVPTMTALEQNFPNPFNPATTIAYRIQQHGWVRLAIFDLLGREVAVLVDQEQAAGRFMVPWSASAASGVYFCRLTVTDQATGVRFQQTRKMLLQR